ncbi:serine-type D-Ala-D-Ala carboxypeptidase, partial [Staphylococcus aureus]
RNSLLWASLKVEGGLTGHDSSAGYAIAASARRKPGGMRVIAVVLGARSARVRKHQSTGLINYAFRFYRNADIWPAGQP